MTLFKPASLRLVAPQSPKPDDAPKPRDDSPKDELYISVDLSLPLDMVSQAQAIVAQRGSGKTYTAKVLAEEFLERDLPVLIVDPLGVFWGLQSSGDGIRAGYAVPILGGFFGNRELLPSSGTDIAQWVLRSRDWTWSEPTEEDGVRRPLHIPKPRSAILDISCMSGEEQRVFVTMLMKELFQHSQNSLHIIVDEADLFAPQKGRGKETAEMVRALEDVVRRGRVKGLGITMITQRPAVISKDVLTQVSNLVILRMMGPHDRKAIKDWIDLQASAAMGEKVLSSLGALPIGTAWFWSPGWLGILKKVRIRRQRTFDSSSTPKVGEERKLPSVRAVITQEMLP